MFQSLPQVYIEEDNGEVIQLLPQEHIQEQFAEVIQPLPQEQERIFAVPPIK